MKKFFLFLFVITFCFLSFSDKARADDPPILNLQEFLMPTTSTQVTISSGEVFSTHTQENQAIQCKNEDCSSYQKIFKTSEGFGIQGENYWMGQDTTFQYRNPDGSLASWLPDTMAVGQTWDSGPLYVVGYHIQGDSLIPWPEAPYSGLTNGVSVRLDYAGPLEFPTGARIDNVAKFTIVGGPGAGEVFYYAQGVGWIGWEGAGMENYPSSSIGSYQGPAIKLTSQNPLAPLVTGQICNVADGGDRTSWPVFCNACNKTKNLTPGCAESFTVNDEVTYARSDVDFWCPTDNSQPWLERTWGGDITVDPTKLTIPFVGKKAGEDEQKYLADYFEGTNEYYKNYEQYWLDWVNHAGVLRKLSPQGYQDQLKKAMVKRAVDSRADKIAEGKIHDYKLKFTGRLCWDAPLLVDAVKGIIERLGVDMPEVTHYCIFEQTTKGLAIPFVQGAITGFNLVSPFKISYSRLPSEEANLSQLATHFPPYPDPNDKDYVKKWNQWKNSKWGRLWEVVMMSSREDTFGEIRPYLGAQPKDKFEFENLKYKIDRVPHLARLFELTGETDKILMPFVQTTPAPPIKQTSSALLAENTYLAQVGSPSLSLSINTPQAGSSSFQPEVTGIVDMPPDCGDFCDLSNFTVSYSLNGAPVGGCSLVQPHFGISPCANWSTWNVNEMQGCAAPILHFNTGDTFSASVDMQAERGFGGSCAGNKTASSSCSLTLTASGWVSSCGAQAGPQAPACGFAPPTKIDPCRKNALSDQNPNDKLCCSTINIKLTAVEQFANPNYEACNIDPSTGQISNPSCQTQETQKVSRKVGVYLLHPYLNSIWQATADRTKGLFNIFRPAKWPNYSPLWARSKQNINYSYTSTTGPDGYTEPKSGEFYFPFLGGIQTAKEWVIDTLMPCKKNGTCNLSL